MIGILTNHIWQSTVFAIVAGLTAATLRENRAQVRYWLWLSASLKFFVPFALLMSLGSHVPKTIAAPPAVSFAMEQIAQPFSEIAPPTPSMPSSRDWLPIAILAVWVCGFLCVALIRFRGWLRIRAAVRASVAVKIPATVEVRSAPGLLEPGVVGVLRPILLLPAGIAERLTPPQLEAVLTHELCHVRRRDNLFASMHMIVEAAFWFHPLVWWIGARLVEERERACDEAVLSLGSEPLVYAEGILNVCKLYVESPLACVSGVTGSDIKKRIEAIMTNRIVLRLNFAKKAALVVAGIAALAGPIVVGILHAPPLRAQTQSTPPMPAPVLAPRLVAQAQTPIQAQTAPLPGGRGKGGSPQTLPAGATQDEYDRRVADAQAKFGSDAPGKTRTYIRYGPPDNIDNRGSDAQNPSQIWRYNYLEDFHSNVEFEFGKGISAHINWPLPVTFEGEPGGSRFSMLANALSREDQSRGEPVVEANLIAGLPGRHASMQLYPVKEYRVLSVPMDSLFGKIDVLSMVETRSDTGVAGQPVANLRDSFQIAAGASAYTTMFALYPGSYVCSVIVREKGTGRMFAETINFEAK